MSIHTPFSDVISAATAHLCAVDPVMRDAIERVGPCTLIPDPDIFNALIDAIISQQISVKAADTIMGRLRATLPDGLVTPETLLNVEHDALRAIGLSTPKAHYVRNLVEHITTGQIALAQLVHLDDEEIIRQLTAVKGIGRWTAEMILIFCLARPDVLPIDDLGFVEAVRSSYSLEERPTRKAMQARGELWRPYRTFATWYMWALRRLSQNNDRQKTRIVSL